MRIKHEVKSAFLVRIDCVCGWYWRNEMLKGKSDEDLALEAREHFEKHLAVVKK